LHGIAAAIRTLCVHSYLELAPAIQGRRALLDVLERLLACTHNASMAHPILRRFELQNLAPRIDRLAAELAEFDCI
jgi:hypothetical protein